MVTEQKIQTTIAEMKLAKPTEAHYLEDRLYRELIKEIASGDVKSIRTARRVCRAALDSDKVLTFRYYADPA